jgi:hypothetical protein
LGSKSQNEFKNAWVYNKDDAKQKKNSKREAMNQEDLKKLTTYETKYLVKCMG